MATSLGDIEIDLYPDKAPLTAGNFLRLVDGGHLDGGSFYRVVTYENDNGNPKIEVIQGGLGGERESPFEPIAHETTAQTGILHKDGVISMARGDVGTASSEFFINLTDNYMLNSGETSRNPDGQGYTAFGRVLSGFDVLREIQQQPTDAPVDFEIVKGQIMSDPIMINRIYRIE